MVLIAHAVGLMLLGFQIFSLGSILRTFAFFTRIVIEVHATHFGFVCFIAMLNVLPLLFLYI